MKLEKTKKTCEISSTHSTWKKKLKLSVLRVLKHFLLAAWSTRNGNGISWFALINFRLI